MKKLFLFTFFVFLVFTTKSQNVSFEATASKRQVSVGSNFNVAFTLNNAKGQDFRPPDFKGLLVLSGPMVSNTMQFSNVYMTQAASYSYTVQCQEVGKCIISPASIVAGGTKMMSNSIEIEVVKGSPPSKSSAQKNSDPSENIEDHIFMKAVVDKTKKED